MYFGALVLVDVKTNWAKVSTFCTEVDFFGFLASSVEDSLLVELGVASGALCPGTVLAMVSTIQGVKVVRLVKIPATFCSPIARNTPFEEFKYSFKFSLEKCLGLDARFL